MAITGTIRTPEALGRAIQQARAVRGLSQRELAAQLGITQRWLWELEQGKPGIFTDRLFAVLRAVDARLEIAIPDPPPAEAPPAELEA